MKEIWTDWPNAIGHPAVKGQGLAKVQLSHFTMHQQYAIVEG